MLLQSKPRDYAAGLLLLAGCADPAEDMATTDDTATAGETATTDDTAEPTFWRDVAPIYYERCVACHQQGGTAPFALDDYASAKAWAEVSASAVAARTMPPWLAVDDGRCGTFRDSKALTEDEIATIVDWAALQAPPGEPEGELIAPPPAALEGATELLTPDYVPQIEGGPLAEADEYRCFAIDPGLSADAFMTGYDVQPGNPAIVHHLIAATVDGDRVTASGETNREVMERLAGESPDREGWPCYEGAGEGVEPSTIGVTWAPGQGVVEFPDRTGMQIGADELIVVQIHYNLADPDTRGQSDSTAVRIRFEPTVDRPGFMVLPDGLLATLFTDQPQALPPGQSRAEFAWDLPVGAVAGEGSVQLHGVLPHMHTLGRSIRLEVVRGSESTCAVDVPRWNFDWQLLYFYEDPLVLQPDDVLRVTCEFDTSASTEPVTPGWGTGQEMCLMGLFVVPS